MWDFFLNKFIKTSHASPVQWRFTMASRLNVRNFRISSRWGSSCFKDGKSGVSSILSWVPFSTRKHQWAVFSSCVNWLGNLSSDEGNTNENATWKCKWLLFYLCYLLALPLTSTETANYPVTRFVGVALKLRKLNEKITVVCSRSQQSFEFGHFILMFCRARQRIVSKFKTHVQNCYFCSLNLLCGGVFTVAVVVAHSALIPMKATWR